METKTKLTSGFLALLTLVIIIISALFLADYISNSSEIQMLVARFGYFGITVVAIVAGLNVIVPIPAASLVPIFTTSGLWLPLIITALTIGTIIADYIGYILGQLSSRAIDTRYKKSLTYYKSLYEKYKRFLLPIIFIYSAFVPFPNEALLIPLALLGVKFRSIFIPLLVGDLINQTIFAIGIQTIFDWLF